MASGKPPWIKIKAPDQAVLHRMAGLLSNLDVHTICKSAVCPNAGDCFARHTATFLLLGEVCTRRCRFCAVAKGEPGAPDPDEPQKIAAAAGALGLDYVVLTSVTRDDLPDGGAQQYARTIQAIRRRRPRAAVEVLLPDFQGDEKPLEIVKQAAPQVYGHNLETVSRLYARVRPRADYRRSLGVISYLKQTTTAFVKSGLMLGLGETPAEVTVAMRDLYAAGCDILTLGQYLQPSSGQLPVARYLAPGEFEELRHEGLAIGFQAVVAGPFVRSSYRAGDLYRSLAFR